MFSTSTGVCGVASVLLCYTKDHCVQTAHCLQLGHRRFPIIMGHQQPTKCSLKQPRLTQLLDGLACGCCNSIGRRAHQEVGQGVPDKLAGALGQCSILHNSRCNKRKCRQHRTALQYRQAGRLRQF